MTTTGYVIAEADDEGDLYLFGAMPFADIAEADRRVRDYSAGGSDPRYVILPVGAPLTTEQIAALKAGHPDDREAEALRAALEAYWRVCPTADGNDEVETMRDAIRAYQLAMEHPEWDAHRVVQALDATTESETTA